MRRRTGSVALAAVLAAALIAGCGGSSNEDQVRDVVESFVQAGKDKDAAEACGLLSTEKVKVVEQLAAGAGCEQVLGGLFARADATGTDVEIQDVRVEGSRATVDATVRAPGSAPKAESILLVKEDGDWKLASVGL